MKTKLDWDKISEELIPNANIFIADNRRVSSNRNDIEKLIDRVETVPVVPYYGVDFTQSSHIVLIIGGETEGISEEGYKLTAQRNGVRLNVPLSNNMDSLNTGTALGVIAFEMKRQLLSGF